MNKTKRFRIKCIIGTTLCIVLLMAIPCAFAASTDGNSNAQFMEEMIKRTTDTNVRSNVEYLETENKYVFYISFDGLAQIGKTGAEFVSAIGTDTVNTLYQNYINMANTYAPSNNGVIVRFLSDKDNSTVLCEYPIQETTPSTKASDSDIKDSITSGLDGKVPIFSLTVASNSTMIIIRDGNIPYYGQYIYYIREACEPFVANGSLSMYSVMFMNKKYDTDFMYTSELSPYGTLMDYRSGGDPQITRLTTVDDLADVFPQLLSSGLLSDDVSEADLAIYNEVWAALDAQPNKSEAEIFAEICGNYGMTADELKDFINTTMDKIYDSPN